jgi:DMSO/TMAO reductase YedYZ molybdopterin-dependent catalytic subunit
MAKRKYNQTDRIVMNGGIWDRRGFIKKGVLAAMATALGTKIMFANEMPTEYVPAALTESDPFSLKELHPEMIKLNDRPWNIEAPPHLLDDEVTPVEKMFVRNNGLIPEAIDAGKWTLTIDGESVKQSKSFTLQELRTKFKVYTYQLTIECGGNGRYGFYPAAGGNQWKEGAVSCARWTGVRLKDVLEHVGIKSDAVYIGYYGKDVHLSGDTTKVVISRGVPIKKATEDETLIAWAMNGKDIPVAHGYPLRLVIGGWPGSVSGKWLQRISIRNKIHDGAKMLDDYRVPKHPVQPGEKIEDGQFKLIESMPVRSVITYPKTGAMVERTKALPMRGHAWAGDLSIAAMHTSIDYGATWQPCTVKPPVNRLAWQQWNATIKFPDVGYYEVWARATDSEGRAQPMVIPAWNPGGYLNNSCHRIAVKII